RRRGFARRRAAVRGHRSQPSLARRCTCRTDAHHHDVHLLSRSPARGRSARAEHGSWIMTTAPSMELIALTKRFGDFVALEDASMRIKPGSFHALLGENGAGKSTLVKCVIGYQAATSGD